MTTISTYLAASLVAVTFGWVPSERAGESQPSEGYDYLVKLSPEDLEAMRDGRAVDLVSELPDDIGPIERVRVYVGEGEAPQQLRDRDRLSPQRIFAESQAKRYEVKKPVTPEWGDAALLEADDANEDGAGERRTAYQNPNTLQEGFAQATRPLAEVGEVIDSQARNLADGTAQVFQQGGDQIRRGAEDLLNGASRTLDSLVPGGSSNPYAKRPPQYDTPSTTVRPPLAGASDAPQQAQYNQPYLSPTYPQQNSPSQNYPPDYQNNPSQGPLSSPPLAGANNQPPSNNGLVQRFTDETNPYGATTRSVLTPVQRGETAASDFGSNASQPPSSTQTNPWDPNYNATTNNSQVAQRSGSAFPELQQPSNSSPNNSPTGGSLWADNFGSPNNTPTGGGFASDRPATNAPVNNVSNGTNPDTAGWQGDRFIESTPNPNPATTAAARSDSSVVIDRLLMLILGGATCFTWIAYIDVRNKYLSVLRAAPGSGYSNAA